MKFTIAVLAPLFLGMFLVADEPIKDPSKLEGRYTIVGGQTDEIPYRADEIDGSVVTIKGSKMTFADKNKKVFFECTFTIDTTGTSTPQLLAMTTIVPKKGDELPGIIDREADTVRICYAQPEEETPTDFEAKKNQYSFVLKRIRE